MAVWEPGRRVNWTRIGGNGATWCVREGMGRAVLRAMWWYACSHVGGEGVCVLHADRVVQVRSHLQISPSTACDRRGTGVAAAVREWRRGPSLCRRPSSISNRSSFLANDEISVSTSSTAGAFELRSRDAVTSGTDVDAGVERVPSKWADETRERESESSDVGCGTCSEQSVAYSFDVSRMVSTRAPVVYERGIAHVELGDDSCSRRGFWIGSVCALSSGWGGVVAMNAP